MRWLLIGLMLVVLIVALPVESEGLYVFASPLESPLPLLRIEENVYEFSDVPR